MCDCDTAEARTGRQIIDPSAQYIPTKVSEDDPQFELTEMGRFAATLVIEPEDPEATFRREQLVALRSPFYGTGLASDLIEDVRVLEEFILEG